MTTKPNTRVTLITTLDLRTDERYQRELVTARVKRMVKNFDWALFGVLEVSQRNGEEGYVVYDGQHRLAAALKLGIEQVPCVVHTDLTPQEEADLFAQLQIQRKSLTQIERFRAQVFSGNAESLAIQKILNEVGIKVDSRRHAGDSISAIMTVERIYRSRGGGHLKKVLSEIIDIWQGKNGSMQGSFVDGFSRFYYAYGDSRYTQEVKDRLESANPMTVLHRSSAIRGGGSQIGGLVYRELRKVAGVRGRPRI